MTNPHEKAVSTNADIPDGVPEEEFKPLSAAEAQQWRQRNPPVSPWRVIGIQSLVAIVATVCAWVGFGHVAGISAMYGCMSVVVPAAALARGMRRQAAVRGSGAALMGFVVWEVVKVVLTVVMLLAAPSLIPGLNWLALVVGFVVTMKVYWVAAWLQTQRKHPADFF